MSTMELGQVGKGKIIALISFSFLVRQIYLRLILNVSYYLVY